MDVRLIMFKNDGQRKEFPLVSRRTVIGRAQSCDLRVPLLAVSRRHCELSVSGAGAKVKDLASSNGTYVNNERINEADLKAGDRLVVGPVVFTVQVDGRPSTIKPVKTRGQVLSEKTHADIGMPPMPADATDINDTGQVTEDLNAEDIFHLGEEEEEDGQDLSSGDPISALEALAAESEDDQEDKA